VKLVIAYDQVTNGHSREDSVSIGCSDVSQLIIKITAWSGKACKSTGFQSWVTSRARDSAKRNCQFVANKFE